MYDLGERRDWVMSVGIQIGVRYRAECGFTHFGKNNRSLVQEMIVWEVITVWIRCDPKDMMRMV